MGVAGRGGAHHLFQNEYRTQNSQFGHFHLTNKCTYYKLLKLLILRGHPPTPYQSLSLAATKSVAWVKYSFLTTSLYAVQSWNYLNILALTCRKLCDVFFLCRSEFSYFEFNAEVKIGTLKKITLTSVYTQAYCRSFGKWADFTT